MRDKNNYRLNVGIVVANRDNRLLWCRRKELDGWQFPQGGIKQNETPEAALWRELAEETGLSPQHTQLLGAMQRWLYYDFPETVQLGYRGQKQRWFLLRLIAAESCIDLQHSDEFSQWCWVDGQQALSEVVAFKREVYRAVLNFVSCELKSRAGLAGFEHRQQHDGD